MSDAGMGAGPEREDDALAAEYVLGLLEPAEQRAFEGRLSADPRLRASVARWSEDLATLLDVAPVAPPSGAEAALMRRLFPEERQSSPRSWFRRIPLVPAILGGLAAALLVAWLALPGVFQRGPAGPDFAATVSAEDGSLVVLASLQAEDDAVAVELQAGAAPPGRVLELWLLPDGGQGAPESLGVLPEGAAVARLPVREDLRDDMPDGVLAISDEPPGGSPEATPTGSVLATGAIATL